MTYLQLLEGIKAAGFEQWVWVVAVVLAMVGQRQWIPLEISNEINGLDQLPRIAMPAEQAFDLRFTSREVTAWGGLALLKRMLDAFDFKAALQSWALPPPGSNRGYAPAQLIEQIDRQRLVRCSALCPC